MCCFPDRKEKTDFNLTSTMSEAKNEEVQQISYNADNRDWKKGWKLYYWQFGGGRGQYVR